MLFTHLSPIRPAPRVAHPTRAVVAVALGAVGGKVLYGVSPIRTVGKRAPRPAAATRPVNGMSGGWKFGGLGLLAMVSSPAPLTAFQPLSARRLPSLIVSRYANSPSEPQLDSVALDSASPKLEERAKSPTRSLMDAAVGANLDGKLEGMSNQLADTDVSITAESTAGAGRRALGAG